MCDPRKSSAALPVAIIGGGAFALALAWSWLTAAAAFVAGIAPLLGLAAGSAIAARLGIAVIRFTRATPQARRNYPRAWRARFRWRWLTRQLGLAYVDPHRKRKIRSPFGPAIGSNVRIEKDKARVRYPQARIRATDTGVIATIRTVPRAGRTEFDKAAEHFANEWGCERVQVAQAAPGRLVMRGLRTDPLAEPFGMDGAPAGVYDLDSGTPVQRVYIGRDDTGAERWVDLADIAGISIAGLPGFGKTGFVLSLLAQLARSGAVQFVFIDGKGGGDYADWHGRAWKSVGDDLAEAAAALEDVHALMRHRLAEARMPGAVRNSWHTGPTPERPLIVTVIDECHTFYDLEAAKGDRAAEPLVRTCRSMTSQIVRKGRSVMMLTIPITQKQTSDAIPTAIRDNCALGFSFAVKTKDAAVAGLGEAIRDYPSYCPTGLREHPRFVGVAVATLPTGKDPFCRLRVPEVTEEAAAERARATEHLRADPAALPVLAAPDRQEATADVLA